MSADLKDFFLATPMRQPEFMRILLKFFPEDIIVRYNLRDIVSSNGYIYIRITKGMYGLKQAAILAYDQLVKNLANHGYHLCKYTMGLWEHDY